MHMSIEVDMPSGDLGALGVSIIAAAERELIKARGNLESGVKVGAPVDTGNLRSSIAGTHRPRSLSVVVTSPLIYASVMEDGRRPGARMPPSEALEEWGQRVLGEKGLGFVLARAIQRRGIQGRKFAQDAFDLMHPKIVANILRAIQDAINRWGSG